MRHACGLTLELPSSAGRWIETAAFCLTGCNEPTADTTPRGIAAATALQLAGTVATDVSPAPAVWVTDRDGASVAE